MPERFDQVYRVKRGTDGKPEFLNEAFFNTRFQDIDLRLNPLEAVRIAWEEALTVVQDRVLEQSEQVIEDLRIKLVEIIQLNWLTALSTTSLSVHVDDDLSLTITDDSSELFTPGPWGVLARLSNPDDYAVYELLSWAPEVRQLNVTIHSVSSTLEAAPGPYADWSVAALAGSTLAQLQLLEVAKDTKDGAIAARDAAVVAKDAAEAAEAAAEAAQALIDAALAALEEGAVVSINGHGGIVVGMEEVASKGQPNGYPSLDGGGKIPVAQLPAAVLGALSYQGIWNATTNVPAIPAAASGNKGWYYAVTVAGNTVIDSIGEWAVNDWIVSNGAIWQKVDNSELVTAVAGLTGGITAAALLAALGVPGLIKASALNLFAGTDDVKFLTAKSALDALGPFALTDGATISGFTGEHVYYWVTLGAAGRALPNPTTPKVGRTIYMKVDGTGTITTWGSMFDFGQDSAPVHVSGQEELLCFFQATGSKLIYLGIRKDIG